MYISHIPLYLMALSISLPDNSFLGDNPGATLISLIFAGMSVAMVVATLILIFSIISIFKGQYSPSKVTMIVKLALVPWYVLNFIISVCLCAGMLNPFLMLAIPIAIVIMVSSTYIYMIATSLPDIAWFIHILAKKKAKPTPLLIVSLVFLFFFCLDIAGGIMFEVATKETKQIEQQ